jgi:hypothetical protein
VGWEIGFKETADAWAVRRRVNSSGAVLGSRLGERRCCLPAGTKLAAQGDMPPCFQLGC